MPTASVFAERFAAQALAGPPLRDAAAVAERLLAVQGQDPRGVRLAVRARSERLSVSDVDRALNERELLITWLNRGTLHLVRSEDYPWLQALTTPPLFTSAARRLAHEGVSEPVAEGALATIERALAEEGPLTRVQVRDRLEAAGAPTHGQTVLHLLFLSGVRGLTVRGPMSAGSMPTFASRTGSAGRSRSTATSPSPSSPAATWSGMHPLTIATSPAGPVCRCGTPAPAWRRSPRSWSSARTGSSTSRPTPRLPRFPARACSAPSTRSCSAGALARRSSGRTTSWSRPTASSAPSPWSAVVPSPPGS